MTAIIEIDDRQIERRTFANHSKGLRNIANHPHDGPSTAQSFA